MTTRVVLAPDKFKGSLTAAEVAEALSAGMLDVVPGLETVMLPVADGGDGTVAVALSAGFDKIMVDAVGPTGEPVRALAPLRATLGTVTLIVASDVDNPLLGPHGAAAVFGPQKGATPQQVEVLERGLWHWSQAVSNAIGRDDVERAGGAAAGGTGFAASALLNAEIDSGIELILDLIDFDRRIAGADLVVTGEGSLDEQSLEGKAPIGVATAAGRAGIPVVAVAGRLQLSPPRLHEAGITAAYALADLEPDLRHSIANASPLLRRIGAQIAKEWFV